MKKKTCIIVTIICFFSFGIWYLYNYSSIFNQDKEIKQVNSDINDNNDNDDDDENTSIENITQISKFIIYITGEVNKPDVYEIEEGSRIKDVLDMAGGPTDEADLESINLAEFVKDAQHIVIPNINDTVDKSNETNQNNSGTQGLININTADKEVLKSLPNIGDVTAENIIKYRENNGNFKSTEEIKNVSRIGDKLYEQIKDMITV